MEVIKVFLYYYYREVCMVMVAFIDIMKLDSANLMSIKKDVHALFPHRIRVVLI